MTLIPASDQPAQVASTQMFFVGSIKRLDADTFIPELTTQDHTAALQAIQQKVLDQSAEPTQGSAACAALRKWTHLILIDPYAAQDFYLQHHLAAVTGAQFSVTEVPLVAGSVSFPPPACYTLHIYTLVNRDLGSDDEAPTTVVSADHDDAQACAEAQEILLDQLGELNLSPEQQQLFLDWKQLFQKDPLAALDFYDTYELHDFTGYHLEHDTLQTRTPSVDTSVSKHKQMCLSLQAIRLIGEYRAAGVEPTAEQHKALVESMDLPTSDDLNLLTESVADYWDELTELLGRFGLEAVRHSLRGDVR